MATGDTTLIAPASIQGDDTKGIARAKTLFKGFAVVQDTAERGLIHAEVKLGGFVVYRVDLPGLEFWNGSTWAVLSVGGGASDIAPVVACATGNVALTGAYTVDGVTLTNGQRYLAPNQTAPAENGIRIYNSAGAHARSTDMDAAAEFRPGVPFAIQDGEQYKGGLAMVTAPAPTTVGTDAALFVVLEPSPALNLALQHSTADAVASRVVLAKSRGTKASPTAHNANDLLGEVVYQGRDASAFYDGFAFRVRGAAAGGTSKRVIFETVIHNGSAYAVGESATQIPLTTSNATRTLVGSLAIGTDEIVSITGRWAAKQQSSSNRAGRTSTVEVRRSGSGNVIEVTNSDTVALWKDDAAWGDATQTTWEINNTTHTVDFYAQGKGSTSIDWKLDLVWAVR